MFRDRSGRGGRELNQSEPNVRFFGLKPLEQCCCCFSLKTGVLFCAGWEIFMGVATVGMIIFVFLAAGSTYSASNLFTLPELLQGLLNFSGMYMAKYAIHSCQKMEGAIARLYYQWALVKGMSQYLLTILNLTVYCHSFQTQEPSPPNTSSEEKVDTDFSDENVPEYLRPSCVEFGVALERSLPFLLLIIYFLFVIFSFTVRLENGQGELCAHGPRHLRRPGGRSNSTGRQVQMVERNSRDQEGYQVAPIHDSEIEEEMP